jgi:TPR repeat protein
MRTILARVALILFAMVSVMSFAGDADAQINNAARMRTLSDASDATDAGDFGRAARLLEPFANQDDPVFMNMLADLYAQGGKDLPKDQVKAFGLYSKAANKGLAAAQRHLAIAYERGQGVTADPAQAQAWWIKAANKGDSRAQAMIGKRRATGEGLPQDYVQAYKWLTLATTGAPAGYEKAAREEAVALRNAITAKMTPMQISDAQKQIREWSPQ